MIKLSFIDTTQCGRSVVQVLVVRVDIGVVTYKAMTPQCGRSVVQVLVVRVDIGVVTYEAMTPQCRRSVVQVLVVSVDIIHNVSAFTIGNGPLYLRTHVFVYIGSY